MSLLLAAALAVAQPAEVPDLRWLAGYWLSCEDGREVSESWSDRRGDIMLGGMLTVRRDGRSGFEQARIAFSSGGQATFIAQPSGQSTAEFRLVRGGPAEAVFENPTHDFPQRVIYRREGERLIGRIEATSGGREQWMEWHYRAAPLNTRCAGSPG